MLGSWNAWHCYYFGLDFPKVWEAGAPRVAHWAIGVMLLFLMAASAWCRVIKVPDHPEALCFQIRGAAPAYVYAVGRGEWEPNGQRRALGDQAVCNRRSEPPKPLSPLALTFFA